MPEIHARLTCLSFLQEQVTDEDVSVIERFVILVYSRTSLFHNVNAARKQMFYTVTGKLTKFYLVDNALYQHILRAVYQSGHIWVQMLLRNPEMPPPSEW